MKILFLTQLISGTRSSYIRQATTDQFIQIVTRDIILAAGTTQTIASLRGNTNHEYSFSPQKDSSVSVLRFFIHASLFLIYPSCIIRSSSGDQDEKHKAITCCSLLLHVLSITQLDPVRCYDKLIDQAVIDHQVQSQGIRTYGLLLKLIMFLQSSQQVKSSSKVRYVSKGTKKKRTTYKILYCSIGTLLLISYHRINQI